MRPFDGRETKAPHRGAFVFPASAWPLAPPRRSFIDMVRKCLATTAAAISSFAYAVVRAARMNAEPDITDFLARATRGDATALDALIPRLYDTLRTLARRQRAREHDHTLQTTALVHEAYLTLAKQAGVSFSDRAHFYAYMSRVMRHALIDHARRRNVRKRSMDVVEPAAEEVGTIDVLALDQALRALADVDARLASVAELRLFSGLTSVEIADILPVNTRTVERDWLKARTFLSACLDAPA